MKLSKTQYNEFVQYTKELGFQLIGYTTPKIATREKNEYLQWIKQEKYGEMKWMNNPNRLAPNKILPEVKTIISLGMNYYYNKDINQKNAGKIAKYAYGKDYHNIIWGKLTKLSNNLISMAPEANIATYTDTGPILERYFAQRSKLGFIGKNTCLINSTFGSWILIAEILTDIEISNEFKTKASDKYLGCGTCKRCVTACPTNAIESPYKINAKKCISYLTIENKKGIPFELRRLIGNRLFGCDICQDVCPWNISRQKATTVKGLQIPIAGNYQLIKDILSIKSNKEFERKFAKSPLLRARKKGLIRNACIVAGNIGDESLLPYLNDIKKDNNEMLAEHAQWAIHEIKNRLNL